MPTDHDLDDTLARQVDGSVVRVHVAGRWAFGLEVSSAEVVGPDVEPGQPVAISLTGAVEALTAGQARELAEALNAAANRLDDLADM